MLDLKFIRENKEIVEKAVLDKSIKLSISDILTLDKEVVALKTEVQELQAKRNSISKGIPKASNEDRPNLIKESKEVGVEIDAKKPALQEKESQLLNLLYRVPNIPSKDAPIGPDESGNVEVKKVGTIKELDFEPRDHVEILEMNNWAEFEKIANVSGSRSYSLRNEMLLLELGIHRFVLDILLSKGFTLNSVPAFAREFALIGTGHFPGGEDQVYHLKEDDLYLSGTAEVQLNSFHNGEILQEKDLPILYAGFSPCFRREAGSYGRDVRGLIRVHQFMKTEQYIICKNDDEESKKHHANLLATAEEILEKCEVPYRVIECCTGDMGTGKFKMNDIESWVPSEKKYRETHSCSTLHDWQARRSNIRYRDEEGNVQFCHTLNNTAIATPRFLVPFIENHQQADGSLFIPEALRPYMGGVSSIKGNK